jgi:hypothetical protein
MGAGMAVEGQITSVSQLRDVKEIDKYYAALQSLVERYGVIDAYPDGTFRGAQPLTRGEFARILSAMLDRTFDLASASQVDAFSADLYRKYSVNKAGVTSISEVTDVRPTDEYYEPIRNLIERYGIDISDLNKNFYPARAVTEKEFYTWMSGIFSGDISGYPSIVTSITRGEAVITFNAALDAGTERITAADEKKAAELNQTGPARSIAPKNNSAPVAVKSQADAISALPTRGKAQIVKYLQSYPPDNTCIDFARASEDLKAAGKNGGIWNGYKIKNDDIGDIVFETNNTCQTGERLVLLRIGTAIVTMSEKGIKRLK